MIEFRFLRLIQFFFKTNAENRQNKKTNYHIYLEYLNKYIYRKTTQ